MNRSNQARNPRSKKAKKTKLQKEKAKLAAEVAKQIVGTSDLITEYAKLKDECDKKFNLSSLLISSNTEETIPNVDRNNLSGNVLKKWKKESLNAFRAITKLKSKKRKKRQIFKKAINAFTKNLLFQKELVGPPYNFEENATKEVLKELSKCYYGRAMLYSTQPKQRAAFRLNANTYLKRMAAYEGDYRNKNEHVEEIAKLLFNSYMDSVQHFERKVRAKNKAKHIEQHCAQAVMVLFFEAFVYPSGGTQKNPDKWFHQYSMVKKAEDKHGIKWEASAPSQRQASKKSSTSSSLVAKSLFCYAKLAQNGNGFTARKAIKKNRCIISEPIIAARWSNPMGTCAECHKQIRANWIFPCDFCTQAAFCSKLCARISQLRKLHAADKCHKYCFRLSTAATLVHRLVELCGGPEELRKIYTTNGDKFHTFGEPKETNIKMVALLISGYAKELESIESMLKDSKLSNSFSRQIPESIHLHEVLKREFSAIPENFGAIVFQLLCFVNGNPVACAKIGRPGVKEQPAAGSRPQIKKRRPKMYGTAIGPLDGLFCYSCMPNVRRQLNLRAGTIEYVAVKDIEEGQELSIGWMKRKQDSAGVVPSPSKHDKLSERFLRAKATDCLLCKAHIIQQQ